MIIYLLDGSESEIWVAVSSIGTILAALAAILYTYLTYRLLNKTSEAAKSSSEAAKASAEAAKATAEAAVQNAIANELSVYLSLKTDLTSKIFNLVSKHCRLNSIEVLDYIPKGIDYEEVEQKLRITQHCLTTEVLNNLEDLSIFWDKDVLKLKTIDDGYGYNILYIGNNNEIRRILDKEKASGIQTYTGLRKLYNAIYLMLNDSEKNAFQMFN